MRKNSSKTTNKTFHIIVEPNLENRRFDVIVTPYQGGLSRLQSLVDGYIERVPVESLLPKASLPYVHCWVNEEGLLKNLQTSMIQYTREGFLHGVIFGNVVFECYTDDGDSEGLPASYVYDILGQLQNMYNMKVIFEDMTESTLLHS